VNLRLFVGNFGRRIGEALLPRTLFIPGLPRPAPVEILIGSLPLSEASRMLARRARRPILAVIDPELTLRRRVELPKAVGAKADAAIGLQLRQSLPGQGQGLVWRSALMSRGVEKSEYGIYLVKQSLIDDILSELRSVGGKVEAITIGAPGLQPVWQLFPKVGQTARNWMAFTAFSVAAIALGSVILGERSRMSLSALVDARAARVAEFEERLVAKREDADKGSQRAQEVLLSLDLFAAQARRLGLLTELTVALPDTVWISELSISGDRLVLSGFVAGDVTDVISIVQGLSWASEVQLNGAISFDSYSGQNRFELGVVVTRSDPA